MSTQPPTSASALLASLPSLLPREPRVGDLFAALGQQGTGLFLAVAAVPALIPTPGLPVGAIFGCVLALIGCAMMARREKLALPPWLARRMLGRRFVDLLAGRGAAFMRRVEGRLRSGRLSRFLRPAAAWPLGLVVLVMGVLVALPIPFGNAIPGLSALVIGLGLVARDGAAVAAGVGLGAIGVISSVALTVASWWMVERLLLAI